MIGWRARAGAHAGCRGGRYKAGPAGGARYRGSAAPAAPSSAQHRTAGKHRAASRVSPGAASLPSCLLRVAPVPLLARGAELCACRSAFVHALGYGRAHACAGEVGESYSSVPLFLAGTAWRVPPGVRDASECKAVTGARPGALPVLGTVRGDWGPAGERGVLWKVPLGSGEPRVERGASKDEADVVVNDVLV